MRLPVQTPGGSVAVPDAGMGPRVNPAAFAAAGEGLQALGQSGQQAGLALQRADERAAASDAARVESETRLDWLQRLEGLKQDAPEGAADFTKGVLKSYDADMKARLEAAPEIARPYLADRLARVRTGVAGDALKFETGSRLAKQTRDLDTTIRTEANSVRLDDDRFFESWGNVDAAIAASGLPEDAKAKVRSVAQQDMAVAAYRGALDKDPDRARRMLDAGEFKSAIGDEAWNTLVNQTTSRQQEVRRKAAAEISAGLDDHLASLQATGQGMPGFSARAKATLEPEAWAEFAIKERVAKQTFSTLELVRFAPPGEIAAAIEAAKPAAGAPEFALKQRAYENLGRAADQMLRLRDKDPAGYAMQMASVADEFRNAGDDAEARRRALTARLDMQGRMGVARPRLLSDAEAEGIKNQIESAPPADRAQMIAGLSVTYRDLAPRVLSELADKKLDTRTMALSAVSDSPGLGQQLAAAIAAGDNEITKGLDATAVRDTKAKFMETMTPLRSAIELADPSGGRIGQANDLMGAFQSLALTRLRQGSSPADAAKFAADALLDRYHVGTTWYAPKVLNGEPIDRLRLLDVMGSRKTPAAIQAFDPEPLESGVKGLDETARRAAVIRAASSLGEWVTSGDGTRAWLMIPLANGSRIPLVRKGGDVTNPDDWYGVGFLDAMHEAGEGPRRGRPMQAPPISTTGGR